MNKIESIHRLIRSLIMEKKIHTQQELQEHWQANGVIVTQSTLSRDMKALNLVKVSENDTSYISSTALHHPVGKNAFVSIWRMLWSCCDQFKTKSS